MILKPTADGPTTVGYASFHQITYPPMRPAQLGQGTPIPSNTIGSIRHRLFNKVAATTPIKPVIKFQITKL